MSKALGNFLRHQAYKLNVETNECRIYELNDAAWAVSQQVRNGHRDPVTPEEIVALIAYQDVRRYDGSIERLRYMAMRAVE